MFIKSMMKFLENISKQIIDKYDSIPNTIKVIGLIGVMCSFIFIILLCKGNNIPPEVVENYTMCRNRKIFYII